MLLGGDEMARTQGGNNNAYAQDSEISWFDWDHFDAELVAFTQRLISFRKAHPVFRRRHFFRGTEVEGQDAPDLAWIRPDGSQMTDEDWRSGFAKSIGVFLNGDAIADPDPRGEKVVDDSFYVVFNAHHEPMEFSMPPGAFGSGWLRVLDSADAFNEGDSHSAGEAARVEARSVAVFRRTG
jgi:glycogen operon protein